MNRIPAVIASAIFLTGTDDNTVILKVCMPAGIKSTSAVIDPGEFQRQIMEKQSFEQH